MYGPKLAFSEEIHSQKYRIPGEDFRAAMNRVASALSDDDAHYHAYREILLNQRFLPGGRVQAAIGSPKNVTAYNCLGAETRFLTRDGMRTLGGAAGERVEVLSPITGEWHGTVVRSFGLQQLYSVEIAYGSRSSGATFNVRATADHRWLLFDGSFTTELKVGDLLSPTKYQPRRTADYELGFVHGFVFGDGTRAQCSSIPTFEAPLCADKDQKFEDIFQRCPWTSSVNRTSRPWPIYYLKVDRDLKALPDVALGVDYIGGFISGWIAADGCLVKDSRIPHILNSVNIEALEWVRDYLPLAGYAPSGGIALTPSGQPTNYGPRKQSLGSLYFRELEMHRGMRVVSIEKDALEEVFCVQVPEGGHAFTLGNGLGIGQCFVSGTIEDSFVEGPGSIMDRLKEAATTMRMGGGIGYNFSTLRPKGALIKKLMSESSGPLPFMDIFSATCLATSSAGNRRGAQMGVMNVDHPDIQEFIAAKQNEHRLRGFNLSIAVTDEFMRAVQSDSRFKLRFEDEEYGELNARDLWDDIMRSTWDWAEPGVLFIDRINEMNNLWYCEKIAATNPCGEQPLPPFGACLLGSFNMVKYLRQEYLDVRTVAGPLQQRNAFTFDWDQLRADIPHVVRAQDNIVDRTTYPLVQQRDEALSKRRMGLGVAGMANAIEALGFPYGSHEYLVMQDEILSLLSIECYKASVELAREKGAFPLFDRDAYAQSKFIQKLPISVQEKIYAHGIRNSHLTSIAPTGTISLSADNISSGIEPVFSYSFDRVVNMDDGQRVEKVSDYGYREFGVAGKRANDVSVEEHVAVLTHAQRFVDSAVSKTCNVPGTVSWEDFKEIYMAAWQGGAKGCTTFRTDGKRAGVLVDKKEEPIAEMVAPVCRIDETTGRRECE